MRIGVQYAEALMRRFRLSYEHLIGMRFAINVAIGAAIVWHTLDAIGDANPIWAIASMIAASEPDFTEARRLFRSRLINVIVGCIIGLLFISVAGASAWVMSSALAAAVLVSSYVVKIKTMWRQAPITAAIVIASGITSQSSVHGVEQGLHKVAEVLFGCLVGLVVSWLMSKVWLIKPPPLTSGPLPP